MPYAPVYLDHASPFAALYFVYILSLLIFEFMLGVLTYRQLNRYLSSNSSLGYISNLLWNVIISFLFVHLLMESNVRTKKPNIHTIRHISTLHTSITTSISHSFVSTTTSKSNIQYQPVIELSVFSTCIVALSELRVFSYYHETPFSPIGFMCIFRSIKCVLAHLLANHIYQTNYVFDFSYSN